MRPVLLSAASLLLAGAVAHAQEKQPAASPSGLFAETIDVTVVNVEVYVTDKKGESVSGLTVDDFELFEDGRPVVVSNFSAIEERRPNPVVTADEPPAAPAEADGREPSPATDAEALPEDQRLHLVVYVDNANIEPFHRNNVYRYLTSFLRRTLTDQDRAALYTYEKVLNLRQPFTSDSRELLDALRETETLSAYGVTSEKERQGLLKDIERARGPSEIEGRLRLYAESIYNDLRFTMDALNEMIEGLAGLPGRKAVVYVSDGLPMRPAEDLYSAFGTRFNDPSAAMESITWDISKEIEEIAQRANANRVTFYTIEAAGLRAHSVGGADTSTSRSYTGIDLIRRQNWTSTLQTMAEVTGGIAITGTSNFAPALARVGRDFDTFYSLGYHAGHGGDGRYHDIDVKVKRKGLEVRHRSGYRAKPPAERMSERTMAALIYDRNSNPLGLDLLIEPAVQGKNRNYLVPLVVRIPIRNVTLIPDGDRHVGRLKLFLALVDEEGRTAQVDDQDWLVEIPSSELERAQDMMYAHEVSLEMRKGTTVIAVGVRDELASSSSFVTRQFTIRGDRQSP